MELKKTYAALESGPNASITSITDNSLMSSGIAMRQMLFRGASDGDGHNKAHRHNSNSGAGTGAAIEKEIERERERDKHANEAKMWQEFSVKVAIENKRGAQKTLPVLSMANPDPFKKVRKVKSKIENEIEGSAFFSILVYC